MNAIYFDPEMDDAARRRALYDGQLIVYSPRPSTLALCEIARTMSGRRSAPSIPAGLSARCPSRRTRPCSPSSSRRSSTTPR